MKVTLKNLTLDTATDFLDFSPKHRMYTFVYSVLADSTGALGKIRVLNTNELCT